MGPVTTQFARLDPGPSQLFGILSAVLTAAGALLIVLAFTVFDWFKGPSSTTRLSDLHRILSHAGTLSEGLSKGYFSWLGWALLAVAVLTALIAATPTVGATFRFIGPVVAAGAIVMTFVGIHLFKSSVVNGTGVSYSTYLNNARVGFYLTLAGFVLVGVGAALGPRKGR